MRSATVACGEGGCAIAVMAKAPRPGAVKTRLVPPLSPIAASTLSAGFLRDITENIALAARQVAIRGYVAHAPAGVEAEFDGMLADGTGLVLADGAGVSAERVRGFGRSLLHAAQALFAQGHDAVCLLNSDSPTLPTRMLIEAAIVLAEPCDRVVLGPAEDGGYYVIGIKGPHIHLFEDIAWSTSEVAAQTRERARTLGLAGGRARHLVRCRRCAGTSAALSRAGLGTDTRPAGPLPRPGDRGVHRAARHSRTPRPGGSAGRAGAADASVPAAQSREQLMATSEPVAARRYFETVGEERSRVADAPPVCIYLEVTNRCNLLCETCPRTFEALEPPADMSWELFTSIVDQSPGLVRAVLHGVGEPMLVKNLPRMIRYLKERGVYVLFNTNGTLLAPRKRQELIETGLDELRVSLDAAEKESFLKVRGKNMFDRIVRNVGEFTALQREIGATTPRVSLWLTGLKETVDQLPDFVRLAARIGVSEVYLQRLVFDDLGRGLARGESSLFEKTQREEEAAIAAAQTLGRTLGVSIDASGATEPGISLKRSPDAAPWSACRRPWSLMYFTAHGRALPCCIAPFSARGYDSYTLGDATQESLREIWNGAAYQDFRAALIGDEPPKPCQNCGLRWSL